MNGKSNRSLTAFIRYQAFGQGKVVGMGRLDDLLECLIVDPDNLEKLQRELSGWDINSQHATAGTPLMFATGRGNLAAVRLFLEKGADPNRAHHKVQITALHLACGGGLVNVCKELLAHSADLEAQDNQGWTPLMFCAQEGHLDCLEMMLSRQANVNATDLAGRTCLMQAARCGHLDVARRLIAAGASIDAKSGWATSLVVAATAGHTAIGELLLDHGAEIDTLDAKEGYSPLMMAAIGGHLEFAEMLMRRGATIDLRTEWNVTALTMATRGGSSELEQVLIDAGAVEAGEVPLPVWFPYGWVGDPILCQQMRQIMPEPPNS
jgi:ankyrin repeat protein